MIHSLISVASTNLCDMPSLLSIYGGITFLRTFQYLYLSFFKTSANKMLAEQ